MKKNLFTIAILLLLVSSVFGTIFVVYPAITRQGVSPLMIFIYAVLLEISFGLLYFAEETKGQKTIYKIGMILVAFLGCIYPLIQVIKFLL